MASTADLMKEIEELCKGIDNLTIRKATDLETLPPEIKDKLKEACSQDPPDSALLTFVEDMGIKSLFPEGREADVFRIWLKAMGFIKAKASDGNDIPVVAWIDMEGESFIAGHPNEAFKGKDIVNMLELRLATISDMYLKTSDILERAKAKLDESTD